MKYLLVLLVAAPTISSLSSLAPCERICEEEGLTGLVGDCCSSSYCDCSTDGGEVEIPCGEGQYFCPQLGACLDFYGLQCDGETFDCCEEITTRTTELTTVQTDTTRQTESLDCEALCLSLEPGATTGDCCSTSYCVCSSDGAQHLTCADAQYFCPQHGICFDFYGEECDGVMFDCCPSSSTTSHSPTSSSIETSVSPSTSGPTGDCTEVCGATTGPVGECCDRQYCDCGASNQPVLCPPQHYFCPYFNSCMDMYGNTCKEDLFDCCVVH